MECASDVFRDSPRVVYSVHGTVMFVGEGGAESRDIISTSAVEYVYGQWHGDYDVVRLFGVEMHAVQREVGSSGGHGNSPMDLGELYS